MEPPQSFSLVNADNTIDPHGAPPAPPAPTHATTAAAPRLASEGEAAVSRAEFATLENKLDELISMLSSFRVPVPTHPGALTPGVTISDAPASPATAGGEFEGAATRGPPFGGPQPHPLALAPDQHAGEAFTPTVPSAGVAPADPSADAAPVETTAGVQHAVPPAADIAPTVTPAGAIPPVQVPFTEEHLAEHVANRAAQAARVAAARQ